MRQRQQRSAPPKKKSGGARGLSQHERGVTAFIEKEAQNWGEGAWLPCQRRQGAGQAMPTGVHACASCVRGPTER
jgi:hypothetical protein